MISGLVGRLHSIDPPMAEINVNGVIYEVQATSSLIEGAAPGEPVHAVVHARYLETGPVLYAFTDNNEREWFRTLLSVQGVAGTTALNLLNGLGAYGVWRAIYEADEAAFKKVSGVGPKLAARLVAELGTKQNLPMQPEESPLELNEKAVNTLVNLGFDREKVGKELREIAKTSEEITAEAAIHEFLRRQEAQKSGKKLTGRERTL